MRRALLCAFALPLLMAAQPGSQGGQIRFPSVEARTAEVDGEPGLHWVVLSLPQPDDVMIGDPQLKRLICDFLAATGRRAWVLDTGTDRSIQPDLQDTVSKQYELTFGYVDPPGNAAPPAAMVLKFRFSRKVRSIVSSLEIRVSTDAWQRDTAHQRSAELGTLAPSVTAAADYAESDANTPAARKTLEAALLAVAQVAWQESQKAGIQPGAEERSENEMLTAQRAIAAVYDYDPRRFGRLNWPRPDPKYEGKLRDGTDWQLLVRRVRVCAGARLEVPVLIRAATEEGRKRAEQIARKVQREASARLQETFGFLKGTVPTADDFRRMLDAVEQDRDLARPCDVAANGPVVVASCQNVWRRYGFTANVAAGWSPEQQASGSGTFSGDNLILHLRPDAKAAETETASLSGLYETQRASAAWQLEFQAGGAPGPTVRHGPRVRGELFRDRNALFANPTGSRLAFTGRSIALEYFLEYGSRSGSIEDGSPAPVMWSVSASLGPSLRYGRVTQEDGAALPGGASPASERSFAALDAALSPAFLFRPRALRAVGVSEIGLVMDARLRRTLPGAAAPFQHAGVWAEATALFGPGAGRDYLVRYRAGVEAASAGTPLFELPRLGGTEQVRGLESGERLGRKLGFAQATAGPSVECILTWFGRKRGSGENAPIRLSDLYVTAIADRGIAAGRGSLAQLLASTDGVLGYGIAAELRSFQAGGKTGHFTIGYGRSPDSQHHRRGVLITAFALDLK